MPIACAALGGGGYTYLYLDLRSDLPGGVGFFLQSKFLFAAMGLW